MIKLFTIQKLLTPENRSTAHPLIFDLHYFEQTDPIVSQNYTLTESAEEADAFLYPLDYLYQSRDISKDEFKNLYELAQHHNKKLLVYTGGDYGKTFNDTRILVWRNAGYRSSNDASTIIVPSFINDPLKLHNFEINYHPYTKRPKIAFTGFATNSPLENLRFYFSNLKRSLHIFLGRDKADYPKFYNAASRRFKYLKALENDKNVETDFIYRNQYRAGAQTLEQRAQTTRSFFYNINQSPYTFCLRGAGNFSIRFFETLACGRIPVLVDTDVALPLTHHIDWDQHICRVPEGAQVAQALLKFHKKFNQQSFTQLQESNRNLFLHTLQRHHFFQHLYPELKRRIV